VKVPRWALGVSAVAVIAEAHARVIGPFAFGAVPRGIAADAGPVWISVS
jgi:hypothetical protein